MVLETERNEKDNTCSMRYQPISHTLYITLHCTRVLSNVVLTTIIEMVEILDRKVGKHSVERVRYVIKQFITLSHCEIWSHFTRSLFVLAFGS